ncbi:hypothetical protein BKA70DRAFT_226740 [Coprinopsis sp. MPI-PUGE-AT-0042]|nr:hypothetical protein BKA70DRAFT_226740 [Coprinopsis sp. MPI-PUGE-AT-0042]
MLSWTGTLASNYLYLPFDEEEDEAIENYERKYLTWVAEPTRDVTSPSDTPASSSPSSPLLSAASLSSSSSSTSLSSLDSIPSTSSSSSVPQASDSSSGAPLPSSTATCDDSFIHSVINETDLYAILGVSNSPTASLDKQTLRRAYLSRSKECHPDKFPGNPLATQAFQRVAVAYDVLSTPALKRRYDSKSPSSTYDVFAARPTNYAEETLRSAVLGVLNDFLDGDLEVVRSLLIAVNEVNPGIRLGDDGINSILSSLNAIRERALTCRTCVFTLHNELNRLLEAQHAFSQLSYFDVLGRTRITIQLTRITVGIPVVLEQALLLEKNNGSATPPPENTNASESAGKEVQMPTSIFPRHAMLLIRAIDHVLDKMERILK